jgi:hypothetical protein
VELYVSDTNIDRLTQYESGDIRIILITMMAILDFKIAVVRSKFDTMCVTGA